MNKNHLRVVFVIELIETDSSKPYGNLSID